MLNSMHLPLFIAFQSKFRYVLMCPTNTGHFSFSISDVCVFLKSFRLFQAMLDIQTKKNVINQ